MMLSYALTHIYAACTAKHSPYQLNSIAMLKMQKEIDCKLASDMKAIISADASRDGDMGDKITKLAADEYYRFVAYEERYLAKASKNVAEGVRNTDRKRAIYERGIENPPPYTPNSRGFVDYDRIRLYDHAAGIVYTRRHDNCVLFLHIKRHESYSYALIRSVQIKSK